MLIGIIKVFEEGSHFVKSEWSWSDCMLSATITSANNEVKDVINATESNLIESTLYQRYTDEDRCCIVKIAEFRLMNDWYSIRDNYEGFQIPVYIKHLNFYILYTFVNIKP